MVKWMSCLCLLLSIYAAKTSAGSSGDELLVGQQSEHLGVALGLGWNPPGIYRGGWGTSGQAVAVVQKEIPPKSYKFGWGVENFDHPQNTGWGWSKGHAHSSQYFNAVSHKGWGLQAVPVGGWGWAEKKPLIINPVINGWEWQSKATHPVVVGVDTTNGWGWPQSKPVIVQPIQNNGWANAQVKPAVITPIPISNSWEGASVNNGWGWAASGYGLQK